MVALLLPARRLRLHAPPLEDLLRVRVRVRVRVRIRVRVRVRVRVYMGAAGPLTLTLTLTLEAQPLAGRRLDQPAVVELAWET